MESFQYRFTSSVSSLTFPFYLFLLSSCSSLYSKSYITKSEESGNPHFMPHLRGKQLWWFE